MTIPGWKMTIPRREIPPCLPRTVRILILLAWNVDLLVIRFHSMNWCKFNTVEPSEIPKNCFKAEQKKLHLSLKGKCFIVWKILSENGKLQTGKGKESK